MDTKTSDEKIYAMKLNAYDNKKDIIDLLKRSIDALESNEHYDEFGNINFTKYTDKSIVEIKNII